MRTRSASHHVLVISAWLLATGLMACARTHSERLDGGFDGGPGELVMISGTDENGNFRSEPDGWPSAAGAWNAKAASFNPATGRLVFETFRADIQGGSIQPSSGITAVGVTEYYVAGPATGTNDSAGTSVLYVANADGTSPRCIGCTDAVNGQNGVRVLRIRPSSGSTPNPAGPFPGDTVYANQNKDLASWTPDGQWLIAGVEMPRHALRHAYGDSEVGQFNDLWAISLDGLTWVQLTDFQSTWTDADAVAPIPYACAQSAQCAAGCQYGGSAVAIHSPYNVYACSASGAPPPAIGTMRPRVSHGLAGSIPQSAKVIWAERLGLSSSYAWRGVQQLASADLIFVNGLPALVNYERNLTPTPDHPDGHQLWNNPGGNTVIGTEYESFNFSGDDASFAVASDAAYSTGQNGVVLAPSAISGLFPDVFVWTWKAAAPQMTDFTLYQPGIYAYQPNGGPSFPNPLASYGHWEEPSVLSPSNAPVPYLAFATTANLDPAWDPTDPTSFALETWVMRQDRSAPAVRLTTRNSRDVAQRWWTYPTDVNPSDQSLYLTSLVGVAGGNAPGSLYRMRLPAF